MPSPVRRGLRLGRHVIRSGQASSLIPPELLSDCRVCASRDHLVALLPHGGRVAEVGTASGSFARHILATCDPVELHVIDIDCSQLAESVATDPKVRIHEGLSHQVLEQFPESHFDWVYIDADHSNIGVLRDAEAAALKVKPCGYLVFNDFAHVDPFLGTYGVHRAVVSFATSHAWSFAWIAYDPNALYDVALRRPSA